MKKFILFFSLFLLIAIAQTSFLSNFFWEKQAPDLAVIFTILISLRKKFEETWIWLLLLGIIIDVFAFKKVGASSFFILFFSYFISFLSKRFFTTQTTGIFLAAGLFVILGTAFNFIFQNIFLHHSMISSIQDFFTPEIFMNNNLLVKIINNLLALAIFYWPFKKIGEKLSITEAKLELK